MGLRPFFTYFGGKWRAAPRYPQPQYSTIIEPFAGSAGYSLRYPEHKIILVEKDEKIAGLWEYLIRVQSSDILALPDLAPDQSVDDLMINQEAKWLIGFWLNKGTSQPCKKPSAWMRSGIRPGSYWGPQIRKIIASQVNRIRHWQVIHGDCYSAPDIPATWYIDPPYQVAGKDYRHGSKGIDYSLLGHWCRTRQGQIIVCENEGADWLPFETFAEIKATPGERRKGTSREVVWTGDNLSLPHWLLPR